MTTTSDPEEIPRLYGALNERILAKDKEGTIQVYYELLRLGRPLSEIMSRAERAEDGPQPHAPSLAGKAPGAGADATLLDEPPEPDSAPHEPAPERLAERASAIIAAHRVGPPDWAIDRIALDETAATASDSASEPPLPGTESTAPAARSVSRHGAMARLSPIALGFAACAIVAMVGLGALLLHPGAQKAAPAPPRAGEPAIDARAGTSPTADAAASDPAIRGNSAAESEPAAAAATPAPPAEPAPSAQPVPEAAPRDMAAATAPAQTVAPPEPAPLVRPAPATPNANSQAAAPASQAPPARPRPAAAEIAGLLARGDGLLSVGDIASARLFYERASDAGNGRAALRLGATYDPGFLDQLHLPQHQGDAARALSWYRRARDLGESEAERWIQGLETRSGR